MCKEYTYKGIVIKEDLSPKFGTPYFTAMNTKKKDKNGRYLHVHNSSEAMTRRIVDCYNCLNYNGHAINYSRGLKNQIWSHSTAASIALRKSILQT